MSKHNTQYNINVINTNILSMITTFFTIFKGLIWTLSHFWQCLIKLHLKRPKFRQSLLQNYINLLMEIIKWFCLLLQLNLAQSVVLIASGASATTIVLPPGQTVQLQPTHQTNHPNYINGAQWITGQPTSFTNGQKSLTFQNMFNSTCPNGSAILTIAAEKNFSLFFNGARLLVGYQWNNVYNIELRLKCGQNNLTVVVGSLNSPAALIFSVNQSQPCSSVCSSKSLYNSKSCLCQCVSPQIVCGSFQIWTGYPVCGCGCPNTKVQSSCPSNQVYNQAVCACQCPNTCSVGFSQNSTTCGCSSGIANGLTLIPTLWPSPWSSSCVSTFACGSTQYWDPVSCSCLYKLIPITTSNVYLFSWQWACRTTGPGSQPVAFSSCQGLFYWNNKLIANIIPTDYTLHTSTFAVEGRSGINQLKILGSGVADTYGLIIDNVVIVKAGNNYNYVVNGDFENPNQSGGAGWSVSNSILGWTGSNIDVGRGTLYNTFWTTQVSQLDGNSGSNTNSILNQNITLP